MHAEGQQEYIDRNRAEQNLKISNRPDKIMDQFEPIGYIVVGDVLVTALRYWWQLWDIGDSWWPCHQHPLYFHTSLGHLYPTDVINIEILSPILKNCHQHLCSRTDWLQDLVIPLACKQFAPKLYDDGRSEESMDRDEIAKIAGQIGLIGPLTWRSLIYTQIAPWWSNEESMDQDKLFFFCNKNLSKTVCQWMIASDE